MMELLKDLRALWSEYGNDVQFAAYELTVDKNHGQPLTRWQWFWIYVSIAVYTLRDSVGSMVCAVRGHHLIDDGSYATPDSGGESLRCTRCGYSWTHIYY